MALHYNEDKSKHELISAYSMECLAQVLTYGCKKYGPNNWRRGLMWSELIGSMERHMNRFKLGEDVDKESGLPHLSHLIANATFLLEYMVWHKNGDDRNTDVLKNM